MAEKQRLQRGSRGLFRRDLGWKRSPSGGYNQHRFYLGRYEREALDANSRLEKLWKQVKARWERQNDVHRGRDRTIPHFEIAVNPSAPKFEASGTLLMQGLLDAPDMSNPTQS